MSGILSKYKDLLVVQDRDRANTLVAGMANYTRQEWEQYNGSSHVGGHAFIKDSPGEVPAVLEVVMALDEQDSFVTLFKPHPLFNNRDSFREGREELVQCVLDIANASILGKRIMCPLRQRIVDIRDLGTKQLVELVEVAVARFQAR